MKEPLIIGDNGSKKCLVNCTSTSLHLYMEENRAQNIFAYNKCWRVGSKELSNKTNCDPRCKV